MTLTAGSPTETTKPAHPGSADRAQELFAQGKELAASSNGFGYDRDPLCKVVAELAAIDSNLAIDLVVGLPDGQLRRELLAEVAHRIAATDPVRALQLAMLCRVGLDYFGRFGSLLGRIAIILSATDVDGATLVARQIPETAIRATAFATVARKVAEAHPEHAAKLYEQAIDTASAVANAETRAEAFAEIYGCSGDGTGFFEVLHDHRGVLRAALGVLGCFLQASNPSKEVTIQISVATARAIADFSPAGRPG